MFTKTRDSIKIAQARVSQLMTILDVEGKNICTFGQFSPNKGIYAILWRVVI
jgi:hypothetical protein